MEKLPSKSSRSEIDQFLKKISRARTIKPAGRRGRLIFAMDATASREPTWDKACNIQAEMFLSAEAVGSLDIQLCHYRGFREFYASAWLDNANDLFDQMTRVRCLAGQTQIAKVLEHTKKETKSKKVNALVFVGDCVEENVDSLCRSAGELGLVGVPAFVFQEGYDPIAEAALKRIAQLSNGAYCRFDSDSAQQLKDLLSAVAVYAAGGRLALESFGQTRGGAALLLTRQISENKR